MNSPHNTAKELETLAQEAGFSLTKLAKTYGFSERHFRRLLKRMLGIQASLWLADLRMRLARNLLVEGLLVKTIAYELGFSDPSSFCKAFRRTHDVSPAQFVLLQREPDKMSG